MKYIYILLLVLSTFFINNSLHAKELTLINAFFLPEDSIQSNTTIKELAPPKKIKKNSPKKSTLTRKQRRSSTSTPNRTLPVQHGKLKKQTISSQSTPAPQKRRLKQTIPTAIPTTIADTPSQPQKSKYTLDDNPNQHLLEKKQEEVITIKEKPKLSELEILKQTEISKILESIPYPTTQEPRFRQLYENHVMDLRVLYRRGKLNPSLQLEKTLEKAKTMRRFEVTNQ